MSVYSRRSLIATRWDQRVFEIYKVSCAPTHIYEYRCLEGFNNYSLIPRLCLACISQKVMWLTHVWLTLIMKQWAIQQPPALTYEPLGVRLCSKYTKFLVHQHISMNIVVWRIWITIVSSPDLVWHVYCTSITDLMCDTESNSCWG